MHMSSRRTVLLVVLVIVSLLAIAWTFDSTSSKESTRSTSSAEARWVERIHTIGGREAYRELSDSIATENPSAQHQQGHVFGGALYSAEGRSGLSVCDAQFNYSCFHEFIGRAIAVEGLSATRELNDVCFSEDVPFPLTCQHGIGHGILASLGYEKKAVDTALEECSRLPHVGSIGGCYGGVFMEFNFRTMLAEDSVRAPLQDDMLFPCNDLRSEYQSACVFWQPAWWYLTDTRNGHSKEDSFTKMGRRCDTFGPSVRRNCYEGIGNITARESNFDARAGATLCDLTSDEDEYRLLCRNFLADSLNVGGSGKKGDAAAVCEDLPDTMRRACMKYVTE